MIFHVECVAPHAATISARLSAPGTQIVVSDLTRMECLVKPLRTADVALFADSLDLPGWSQSASPFTHTPQAPLDSVAAAPLLIMGAVVARDAAEDPRAGAPSRSLRREPGIRATARAADRSGAGMRSTSSP